MRFRNDRPIFQQIIERLEEQILTGELRPEERIPAVREYAFAMEVNPNTVVRCFMELENAGVIFKKRGLGSFVSPDARKQIIQRRRHQFMSEELPNVVKNMHLLGIKIEVLEELYKREAKRAAALYNPEE